MLRRAAAACAAVAREDAGWLRPMVALARAGIARVEGDAPRAIELLREADREATAAGLRLHAAAARHRLGELVGGDDGAALAGEAAGWLRDGGVVRPDALLRVLAPGW